MEKRRPILTVRPKFDPGLTMIQSLGVTLGGFLVTTIVFGSFFFIFFTILGLRHVTAGGIYGFFCIISLLGIPPVFYEIKKRALQRTMYNFYDDYMDFQYFHWYINRRRGRIRYMDIADIAQHASALQEHQRLITIYVYVPGMGMGRRGAFAGVKMADLPQARDYMTKIMDLIEGRAAAAAAAAAQAAPPVAATAAPVEPTAVPAEAAAAPAEPVAAQPAPAVTQQPASPSSPPPVTDG